MTECEEVVMHMLLSFNSRSMDVHEFDCEYLQCSRLLKPLQCLN